MWLPPPRHLRLPDLARIVIGWFAG
jgi:hypothetical protein